VVVHGLKSCNDYVEFDHLVDLTQKDDPVKKTSRFEAHFESVHDRAYTGPRALKKSIVKITDQEVELRRRVRRAKPTDQSGTTGAEVGSSSKPVVPIDLETQVQQDDDDADQV
jgi:hypothetical protein